MEYEIFNILKNYTLETFLIAMAALIITYLIKIPIKKKTSTMEENKRKMINTVIMIIPLIVSLIASIVYYGIVQHEWLSLLVVDSAISSWLLSLSMYAIVSRICIIIKGIKSGKLTINAELSKDTLDYIKKALKTLDKENKTTNKDLNDTREKLKSLTELRDLIASNESLNLSQVSEMNVNINKLQVEQKISDNSNLISKYKEKLYLKK